METDFDKLNRQIVKLVQGANTPKAYIKAIADLEDFMNETIAKQKVSTKKMNATNARGLNAVKQRIKKNNKDYAKEIDEYREDKDKYMESDEEVEDEELVTKAKKSKTALDISDPLDEEGFSMVGKGGKAGKTLVYTPESIFKHLRTIVESRGKKNTDKAEQIRVMEKLLEVATTPYQKIRVLLALISTRFDLLTGSTTMMSQEQWKLLETLDTTLVYKQYLTHLNRAEREFATLLEVLEATPNMVVLEHAEEWEDDEKPPQPEPGEKLRIPGSIVSFIERLDDELTRSLQHIDPHTAEYIERLSDEGALYTKIVRGLLYYENLLKDPSLETPTKANQESTNRVLMRRLEHIYFKACDIQAPSCHFSQVNTDFMHLALSSCPDP